MTLRTEWRSSWQIQVFTGVLFAVFLVIAAVIGSSQATVDDPSNLVFLPIFGVMFAVLSSGAYGASVRVDDNEVIASNVFVKYRYELSSVQAISSKDERFLVLELVDGRRKTCWAVQATNLMLMMNKRTRVDEVGDEIRYATKDRLGGSSAVVVRRSWAGIPLVGWIFFVILQLPALFWLFNH